MAKRVKAPAGEAGQALTRRTKQDDITALTPDVLPMDMRLTDEMNMGALGLVEITLTDQENKVLSKAVEVSDVRCKPTGQPYLSHPTYTKWFNEAFGRLGWALVPCAKPSRSEGAVVCPYVLHIHGQPAAFALGEQEYHIDNKEQTYGDAFEATVASALRRMAKRLGVGLELWDKVWIDTYLHEHCVKVWCTDKRDPSKGKYQWRRKVDPPFWNETGGGSRQEPSRPSQRPATRRSAPAPSPDDADEPPIDIYDEAEAIPEGKAADVAAGKPLVNGSGPVISEAQRKRLYAILTNSGRNEAVVKAWLKTRYGYDSSKDIHQMHYEAICTALETPGRLPL